MLCFVPPTLLAAQAPVAVAGTGERISFPTSGETYDNDGFKVPKGMVLIPTGSFQMGGGGGRGPGPHPTTKTVTLPAYAIGKYDVTNAEYKAFVVATGRRVPGYWKGGTYPEGKANHPVAYVSLVDARAYAAWVAGSTGWKVAIPTAEQWEKAARGPRNTLYPWGDSLDASIEDGRVVTRCNYNLVVAYDALKNHGSEETEYSNPRSILYGKKTTVSNVVGQREDGSQTRFSVSPSGNVQGWVEHSTYTGFIYTSYFKRLNDAGGNTTPVGSYESGKSGYGAYDMAGELWNWTEGTIVATNGAEAGKTVNEIRGGSWYATGRSCQSVAIGEGRRAEGAYNTVGFRIVVNLQ